MNFFRFRYSREKSEETYDKRKRDEVERQERVDRSDRFSREKSEDQHKPREVSRETTREVVYEKHDVRNKSDKRRDESVDRKKDEHKIKHWDESIDTRKMKSYKDEENIDRKVEKIEVKAEETEKREENIEERLTPEKKIMEVEKVVETKTEVVLNSWSTDEEEDDREKLKKLYENKNEILDKVIELAMEESQNLAEEKKLKKLKKKEKERKKLKKNKRDRPYKNEVKLDYNDYEKNIEEAYSNWKTLEESIKPRNIIKIDYSDFDSMLLNVDDKRKESPLVTAEVSTTPPKRLKEIIDLKELNPEPEPEKPPILEKISNVPELESPKTPKKDSPTDVPIGPSVQSFSYLASEYEEFMKACVIGSSQDYAEDSSYDQDDQVKLPEVTVQKEKLVEMKLAKEKEKLEQELVKEPELEQSIEMAKEPEKTETSVTFADLTSASVAKPETSEESSSSSDSSDSDTSSDSTSESSSSSSSDSDDSYQTVRIKQEKLSDAENEIIKPEDLIRKRKNDDPFDIASSKMIKIEKPEMGFVEVRDSPFNEVNDMVSAEVPISQAEVNAVISELSPMKKRFIPIRLLTVESRKQANETVHVVDESNFDIEPLKGIDDKTVNIKILSRKL